MRFFILLSFILILTGCSKPSFFDDIREKIVFTKQHAQNAEACHDQLHELGHEMYAIHGLSSLDASDESCNAGYIHGVIESALDEATDPIALMKTLCDKQETTTFSGWECVHGIGHGLMYYTQNDLPTALSFCQELKDPTPCVNGVWMENFVADVEVHATEWRKSDASFFPCEEELFGRKDCYLYAPIWHLKNHDHDYKQTMTWCEGAGEYQSTCVEGVGAQAMKDVTDRPEDVVSVCDQSPDGFRDACIRGMTGMLVFHYASTDKAEEWCSLRTSEDQAICTSTLRSLSSLFE